MGATSQVVTYMALLVLAMFPYVAFATDPNQLQDFCVGVNSPQLGVFVNGRFCKDPMKVDANDFLFRGLNIPGNTINKDGSNVTRVDINTFPGLNTLGISLARIDVAPHGGLNTPHHHPRATEVITVIKGTLYAGFIASNPPKGPNRFFFKVLNEGDVFIFPQGMIHFEMNFGEVPAFALSSFSSQFPGVVTTADAVFGSSPPVSVDLLAKAFQLDPKIVKYLQTKFGKGDTDY